MLLYVFQVPEVGFAEGLVHVAYDPRVARALARPAQRAHGLRHVLPLERALRDDDALLVQVGPDLLVDEHRGQTRWALGALVELGEVIQLLQEVALSGPHDDAAGALLLGLHGGLVKVDLVADHGHPAELLVADLLRHRVGPGLARHHHVALEFRQLRLVRPRYRVGLVLLDVLLVPERGDPQLHVASLHGLRQRGHQVDDVRGVDCEDDFRARDGAVGGEAALLAKLHVLVHVPRVVVLAVGLQANLHPLAQRVVVLPLDGSHAHPVDHPLGDSRGIVRVPAFGGRRGGGGRRRAGARVPAHRAPAVPVVRLQELLVESCQGYDVARLQRLAHGGGVLLGAASTFAAFSAHLLDEEVGKHVVLLHGPRHRCHEVALRGAQQLHVVGGHRPQLHREAVPDGRASSVDGELHVQLVPAAAAVGHALLGHPQVAPFLAVDRANRNSIPQAVEVVLPLLHGLDGENGGRVSLRVALDEAGAVLGDPEELALVVLDADVLPCGNPLLQQLGVQAAVRGHECPLAVCVVHRARRVRNVVLDGVDGAAVVPPQVTALQPTANDHRGVELHHLAGAGQLGQLRLGEPLLQVGEDRVPGLLLLHHLPGHLDHRLLDASSPLVLDP
mmetsp:Transcript_22429/g.59294  ORF Transcript_22429/g.59294 Transcript_22429/m.59294 type:complete len:617 (-) Transcript_22429:1354-3204(-)